MPDRMSTRHCLRTGMRTFLRRPLPLLLAWFVTTGISVGLFVVIPQDLSSALQMGTALGWIALVWAQLDLLRFLGADVAAPGPAKPLLARWGSLGIAVAVLPTVFRVLTFALWYAVPLTGGIMYMLVTFGVADMYVSGRLDLLTSAILFGFGAFMLTCGFGFAPVCSSLDRIGPLEALRRSWRIAGGHRIKILAIATATMSIPVAVAISAYHISILQTAQATFQGLPAVLWTISLAGLALFFGPWLTAAMTVLFIPLKGEENVYVKRRLARRESMNLS